MIIRLGFLEQTFSIRRNDKLLNERVPATFSTKQISQPTFTCSKLTIETLEQGVKYIQS